MIKIKWGKMIVSASSAVVGGLVVVRNMKGLKNSMGGINYSKVGWTAGGALLLFLGIWGLATSFDVIEEPESDEARERVSDIRDQQLIAAASAGGARTQIRNARLQRRATRQTIRTQKMMERTGVGMSM